MWCYSSAVFLTVIVDDMRHQMLWLCDDNHLIVT